MDINQNNITKRHRSSNFTEREKNLLFSLVFKYKNIIENKKTDGTTIHEKRETWEKIRREFNSASPGLIPRSSDFLKKFYDNRKKELRKDTAKERCEIYKTGGDDFLLAIVNEKTVFGLENPFDGDSLNLEPNNNSDNEISHQTPKSLKITDGNCDISVAYKRPDISTNSTPKKMRTTAHLEENILLDDDELVFDINNEDVVEPHAYRENENYQAKNDGRQNKMPCGRRRPATVVKALSSSNIAEKYDKLLDQRLLLCNYDLANIKKNMHNSDLEHKIRVDSLRLDIQIKKRQLEALQKENIMENII